MKNLFGESLSYRGRQLRVLGCSSCPLNKTRGVNKVKGLDTLRQRKAMLWAQSPGKVENAKRQALIGPSGQLTWKALLQSCGLTRDDFDIQNVLRCQPLDKHGNEHKPDKRELECCSVYNEQALEINAGSANVHLILGEVAGKQLLRSEYKKSRPVFWYEPWKAYVVLSQHPAYILRNGGEKAEWLYSSFSTRLRAVQAAVRHPGRWGYVKAQNYGAITSERSAAKLERILYAEADKGRRVSLDIETGIVDGKPRILMVGFGWGSYKNPNDWQSWKGGARSVVLWHPEIDLSPKRINPLLRYLRKWLSDSKLRKVLQHGSYDKDEIRDSVLKTMLRGYDYDTQYGTYLYRSHLRSYSLDSIIRNFLPEFQDYKKSMVAGYEGNLATMPLKQLVLYNCADCDVTKRTEALTAPNVSEALVRVYIHTARTIDAMEQRGPWLDQQALARVKDALPGMIAPLESKLRHLANDPELNPKSQSQLAALLYDKLKLPGVSENRSTNEGALRIIEQQTKSPVPRIILDLRALYNIEGTFIKGYERSAAANDGRLRTIWWLTGAVTGRLRSGRGQEQEAKGIVNFQNLHGNPIMQSLLVSDPDWRLALEG